jgi:hypothetical protein
MCETGSAGISTLNRPGSEFTVRHVSSGAAWHVPAHNAKRVSAGKMNRKYTANDDVENLTPHLLVNSVFVSMPPHDHQENRPTTADPRGRGNAQT